MATVTDLEQQLEAARVAEKQAARDGDERRKQAAREMAARINNANTEVRAFRAQAEQAFSRKGELGRPPHEARSLSRAFLHAGLEMNGVYRLSAIDGVFGSLIGTQQTASQMQTRFDSIGVVDEAIGQALDELEAKAWGLAYERAKFLAGEV
jgi:hypothetical protein